MKNIAEIDKNFKVETKIVREGLKFYDPEQPPFSIHGVRREGNDFVRLPSDVAGTINDGVYSMRTYTAGGRIRFVTDSPYVVASAHYSYVGKMPHFALTGSIGLDLYADGIYRGTYTPDFHITDTLEGVVELPERKKHVITINLPTYSALDRIYIGLDQNACVEKAPDYKIKKPVVFYGSSITHGGCASKPGSTYESILERRFDFDYVNLGFSGSARAEDTMAKYLADLEMSLFVYDYDHNAPNPEYLKATHEKLFLKIREKQPDLPIIMMSRPKFMLNDEDMERLDIIRTTYGNAIARGDKNVYFIDGRELMAIVRDNGTVDNCHPTDSGFWNMAQRLGDEIEKNYKMIFEK